jgi:hypothetical protein
MNGEQSPLPHANPPIFRTAPAREASFALLVGQCAAGYHDAGGNQVDG